MPVALQVLFDVDLPAGMEAILDDQTVKEDVEYKRWFSNGQQFAQEFPALLPWMVRNGYAADFQLLLTVIPDDKKVDQPVAQQGPL